MSRMTWGVPSLSCVDIKTPRPSPSQCWGGVATNRQGSAHNCQLTAWCLVPLLGSSPRCSLAHCSGSATNLSQPLPTAHSYSLASPSCARKIKFTKTRGTVDSLSMDKLYPDCLQLQCMMRIFSVWECASWELVLVSPQSAAADSISDNEAANNLFTLTTGHTHTNVVDI